MPQSIFNVLSGLQEGSLSARINQRQLASGISADAIRKGALVRMDATGKMVLAELKSGANYLSGRDIEVVYDDLYGNAGPIGENQVIMNTGTVATPVNTALNLLPGISVTTLSGSFEAEQDWIDEAGGVITSGSFLVAKGGKLALAVDADIAAGAHFAKCTGIKAAANCWISGKPQGKIVRYSYL